MSFAVAIIGTGLVGRAWAIAFARAGCECRLYDATPGAAAAALDRIAPLLDDMVEAGLIEASAPVLERLHPVASPAEALASAAWMQESIPENLELKREVWSELDRTAPPLTILASSTSAIVPSLFTEHLERRGRCVVAHPLNPPYLIPAVELVPAPWTGQDTMARATRVIQSIGMAPIVMTRELDGFVMNRLQGALLEESFRLVEGGYCTAEDVDRGLKHGLALRWSFMGPFETIDLNAPAGVRDYCVRYQHIYENLHPSMQRRADWTGKVLDQIEAERRAKVPSDQLDQRQRWRDKQLMALAAHKKNASSTIGD